MHPLSGLSLGQKEGEQECFDTINESKAICNPFGSDSLSNQGYLPVGKAIYHFSKSYFSLIKIRSVSFFS